MSNKAASDCSTSTTLGARGWKVSLSSNGSDTGNDFGNFQQATKSGQKFNDLNNNGVKDAGEPGLSGWTINVYANGDNNAVLSAAEFSAGTVATTTTDASGNYSFNLNPGNYIVCEAIHSEEFDETDPGSTSMPFGPMLACRTADESGARPSSTLRTPPLPPRPR